MPDYDPGSAVSVKNTADSLLSISVKTKIGDRGSGPAMTYNNYITQAHDHP